jgi:hypothetical protein
MKKRILSLALALIMALSLVPAAVAADVEAPTISDLKIVYTDESKMAVSLEFYVKIPESAKSLDSFYLVDAGSFDGGDWEDIGFDGYNTENGIRRTYPTTLDADAVVKYRVRYQYRVGDDYYFSPWSNVLTLNEEIKVEIPPSSDWAKDEIEKALDLGLIPDSLKTADLTKPITRAEFAAVSVKAYEALSGTKALPAVVNPFTDTKDTEVLKAYNLGITAGTTATTFSPNVLLNREQAATMLTRVFKRVTIPGWTLATDANIKLAYTKPPLFADDAKISGYAKDSVYFMVANGIINGVGDNKFAPQNITDAEKANGYANATREQALIIATRMVVNLDVSASSANGNYNSDSDANDSKTNDSKNNNNPKPGNVDSNIDEYWIDNEFTRLIPKPWEGTIAGFLDTETVKLGAGGYDYAGIEVSMTKITEGELYIQKCREMGWIVKDAGDVDTSNELFSYLKIYNKMGYDMSVYYNKQAGKEIGTLLIGVRRAKSNTP